MSYVSVARPVGFFLLMVGFGLRLDTTWQTLASGLLLVGAASVAIGLRQTLRSRSWHALPSVSEASDNAASAPGG